MADLGTNLKTIWMKGMEAIGRRASDIASNTKFKVDEMNMVTRRAEIMKDFGARAYALWQKGEQFPEELAIQLKEVSDLDEKLNDMRAQRIASVKENPSDDADQDRAEDDGSSGNPEEEYGEGQQPDPDEYEQEQEPDPEEEYEQEQEPCPEESDENDQQDLGEKTGIPVIQVEGTETEEGQTSDLSGVISDIFQKVPSADEAAEKVNSAIDSLEDGLKQFSDGMDSAIDQLTDRITGEKEE